MVLFSPDFKYKVDSFNLDIIGNYVKSTIGEMYIKITRERERERERGQRIS